MRYYLWLPGDPHPATPIWDELVAEWEICHNCWCWDCGCCYGCGQIDSDLFGAHGYVCVMGVIV